MLSKSNCCCRPGRIWIASCLLLLHTTGYGLISPVKAWNQGQTKIEGRWRATVKKGRGRPQPTGYYGSRRVERSFSSLLKSSTEELREVVADDSHARSMFGTKGYWDELYEGRGDFPSDEYSWYYGWDILGSILKKHCPSSAEPHILLPGIGNDPILLDLLSAKYKQLTAQDYSPAALDRQRDLLWDYDLDDASNDGVRIDLCQGDVRKLPTSWTDRFDVILEKGLLDAVYLSGDGFAEQAVRELGRVLKPGGVFISVSGVVEEGLRKKIFSKDSQHSWSWLRDGSADLKAGCFVFEKAK